MAKKTKGRVIATRAERVAALRDKADRIEKAERLARVRLSSAEVRRAMVAVGAMRNLGTISFVDPRLAEEATGLADRLARMATDEAERLDNEAGRTTIE